MTFTLARALGAAVYGRRSTWSAERAIKCCRLLACDTVSLLSKGVESMTFLPMEGFNQTLINSLDVQALERALRATMTALLTEAEHVDTELARRLAEPIGNIASARVSV